MKQILIDTNVYTAFMYEQAEVVEVMSFAEDIVICPTVLGELLAGFKSGSKEKQNRAELDAFLDVDHVREVFIDSDTSEFYAEIYRSLRKKGKPIPSNDLWIAASALQHGLSICTLDAHFSLIEGLLSVKL